jgi:hypothetical protein
MGEEGDPQGDYDHLTPAERRYIEQKQKIDVTIDKVALKKAIQNGEKVDGAHIEQNEKLVY